MRTLKCGSIRQLGLGLAAAAVLAGGCRRARRYATVQHLSSSPAILQEYGGDSRPAVEISPGTVASWTLPPGSVRHLHTAYLPEEKNGKLAEGRLVAELTLANGRVSRRRERVGWAMGRAAGWQEWEFEIPASNHPAHLTVSFRPDAQPAPAPGVFLTPPTLSAAGRQRPRLFVLFVIDTLRKDRLSAYGYKLPTSPQIDRFFADGTIWNSCFANSTWTLPSHATIFTSTLPNRHGVGERIDCLPEGLPTLAEILSRRGYRTIAVTNGGYVDPSFGFGRGFDVYTTGRESTQARVGEALRLLDRYQGEPTFLFLHTYQVHEYSPKSQSAQELFGSVSSLGPAWTRNVADIFNHSTPRRVLSEWLNHRYDASIRSVDDGFGDLVQGLRDRGLLGSTAIVLTSDHGEEIFDRRMAAAPLRGLVGHIHPHLYEEYLAVPLLLKCPWIPSRSGRIDGNVSLVDVAPTILSALGIAPPPTFQGRSLLDPKQAGAEEVIVSKAPRYDAIAVRRGVQKLILRPSFPLSSWEDGDPFGQLPSRECFDLANDPAEKGTGECRETWVGSLDLEAERYVAASFPGSAVIRFPPRAEHFEPREIAVRARARDTAPSFYYFGILPGGEFWTRGNTAEGRFRIGASPAWLAIRPARQGEALEVDLFGRSGLRPDTRRWGEILWRGGRPLPETTTLFSTAPGEMASSPGPIAPQGGELLARLRSLGYLAADSSQGRSSESRGHLPVDAPNPEPMDVPDGEIEVRTESRLPPWRTPVPLPLRRIIQVSPSTVHAGEMFNAQPDGSCAIGLTGEGFTPEDTIFWNGTPLKTTFGSSGFITGKVPRGWTSKPQRVDLRVRSAKNPALAPLQGALTVTPSN